MYNYDQQLLLGLQVARERYAKEDQRQQLKKSIQYQPQHFNQHEHPSSLFTRSQIESIPMAQPGMVLINFKQPVIPLPFTLIPWPMESQIQMGFDYDASKRRDEIRQQRIDMIMNIGKPKTTILPGDKIMYPHESLQNSRFAMLGQQQLNYSQMLQQQQVPQNYQYMQQQPQIQQQINTQVKQQLDNLLLKNEIRKPKVHKEVELNEQQMKREFQNSLHRSKNSDNNRSSDHSSKQLLPRKQKKKLPVSSKKFRIFKASVIFISYYVKTLNSEMSKKIKLCRERDKQIPDILEYILGQYEEVLESTLIEFLNNKIDFKIERNNDKENKMKIEKIYYFLLKFLNAANKLKTDNLHSLFFEFLKSISMQGQFPPLEYYIQYEAEKIRFNTLGQIGKISESLQLMIIEGLILIRTIVFQIFFKAFEYYPDQENQEVLYFIHKNAFILGSILSYIFLERHQNEIALKFNWDSVNWNKIKILPQLYQDEPDFGQKTIIKDLISEEVIAPFLKLLQQDVRRYGQLNDQITLMAQSYLTSLKKHIEQTKKVVEQKPRMISLIMNTIYREIYISKKPKRVKSN